MAYGPNADVPRGGAERDVPGERREQEATSGEADGPDGSDGYDGWRGLARELVDRIARDGRLTTQAQRLPGAQMRRRVARCRAINAAALHEIVEESGWPTAELVGEEASTAALMILLHADDLALKLSCRDLITDAVERGQCPPIHAAYATDHCAVELGRPQPYGTRYTPLGRPYPVADPEGVDARRVAIGLRTMAAEQQALAEIQLRRLSRASA
ncbi:DUF6624 domain-containing protein [Streptomyces sp. NRRL F-5126]|uniref:DUF6624 domain-containing protein n=1 Tax=Streptomyces sp. NRRL F-5126 TaxID=1463857 RepID=UPI000AB7B8CD|nr:DUF6624 domain-containing protein [Streptomyces sp. NRRL F-5126]